MLLSTYLSDHVRLFKRADALLKVAASVGLPAVTFAADESQFEADFHHLWRYGLVAQHGANSEH